MPVRYRRLVFQVETGDLEPLTAALWELGTLGTEQLAATAPGSLVAYFAAGAPGPEVDWSRCGARLVATEEFEDRDWMKVYRARARPLEVGDRLIVDPREPGSPLETTRARPSGRSGRRLLRLPARTAFGTGEHPSTRLVVELLDRIDLAGLRVLDVGVGSGILSFAAQLFGASRVVGVEIDPGAALVAGQNRPLNGLYPSFVAGGVGALGSDSWFDLALVNVLPERVAADLGDIRCLLRSGGSAIFSGLSSDSLAATRARLEAAGYRPLEERGCEEWSALLTVVGGA